MAFLSLEWRVGIQASLLMSEAEEKLDVPSKKLLLPSHRQPLCCRRSSWEE